MKSKDTFADLRSTRVLLIEDDSSMREVIEDMLDGQVAALHGVSTCAEGFESAKKRIFDVALIDVNLPDGRGFDIIRQLKKEKILLSVILITGFIDEKLSGEVDEAGIQTLLTKPFSPTQLKFSINREAARKKRCEQENGDSSSRDPAGHGLVGISRYTRDLRKKIEDFAAGDMPVLITGPTGTGKEIIARAIHKCSLRGDLPLITVNSSAIPEHLEESEFFGYAKGAFTGAYQSKDGILKCADGSSLFLDEVAELSLRMQVKLLRVLDGHDFMRIGETNPVHSDFRLVSATNRPLQEMIKAGSFREDLFFRLKATSITTLPLEKHKEDIPALIRHFLCKMRREKNREFEMSPEALEVMIHYNWPGNIRELKNTVESMCMILKDTDRITRESVLWVISETGKNDSVPVVPFSDAKMDFERDYYRTLLTRFNGNISMAARASGIERAYFSRRIKALDLTAEKVVTRSVPKTEHDH